jgi:lysophospholipase L1-like esterase
MNAKHYPDWDSEVCTLVDSPKGERVLMWGDSFLNHYTKGFESLAKQQQLTLIKYASAGCPPIMTFESFALPYCDEFNRNALELIEALDIDVVFLSAKWSDHQKAGLDRLTSTLEKLDNLGVRYLVFGQSPQFITDVSIIDDQKGQGKASNAWPTTIKEAINQELELLITSGDFINPMPSLCEAGVCEYKLNGEMLFSDYGHLSQQGSLVVVNTLTNDIERWLKQ